MFIIIFLFVFRWQTVRTCQIPKVTITQTVMLHLTIKPMQQILTKTHTPQQAPINRLEMLQLFHQLVKPIHIPATSRILKTLVNLFMVLIRVMVNSDYGNNPRNYIIWLVSGLNNSSNYSSVTAAAVANQYSYSSGSNHKLVKDSSGYDSSTTAASSVPSTTATATSTALSLNQSTAATTKATTTLGKILKMSTNFSLSYTIAFGYMS